MSPGRFEGQPVPLQSSDAEQTLAAREAVLKMTLEQMPAVVWTTDRDLVITSIHGGSVPGMREQAMLIRGRPLTEVLGERGSHVIDLMQHVLSGETMRYTYEYSERVFDVCVEPLRDAAGIQGTVAVAFDVTRHVADQHALRASREELRELSAKMNAIEENERRRVAREIHDEMGQRLTALRLELDLLRRELGGAAAARIAAMKELIADATESVRRIASALRPALLDDFGFREAVAHEVASLQRRTGIHCDLSLPPREPPLHRDATTALYRIVQEALTNIARHSGANNVRVTVEITPSSVELEVADDGRGMSAEPKSPQSLGLTGARERAFAFGGELRLETSPGGGTRLFVRLPTSGRAP